MPRPTTTAPTAVRRRPKDRKAQIARAAAEAFSALGYHEVTVEHIASRVGISAPAVYRHYTGKYDLFRGAVLSLGQEFVDTVDVDTVTDLGRLLPALLDVVLRNRAIGGLNRWQARYLREPDAALLAEQVRLLNRRVQRVLAGMRPALTTPESAALSAGILSTAGSVVDHHVRASERCIRTALTAAATAVAAAELPRPGTAAATGPAPRIFTAGAGGYEAVLHAALTLFARHGYTETTVAQIAAAAELPMTGIYRYYQGKADILATLLRRAADRLSAQLTAVGRSTDPRTALSELVGAYVGSSFANPELATIYYSELVNLAPADQAMLRNIQRATIGSWVRLLTRARPDLDARSARLLVHAAMSLVVDLDWLAGYDALAGAADAPAHARACVGALMRTVLFDSVV